MVVLGIEHEAEAIWNCGGVKEKFKGGFGCSLLPGLKELKAGEAFEINCEQNEGKQVTGTCLTEKAFCEQLAKNPLLGDFGGGFIGAGESAKLELTFNKDVLIDD